MNIDSNNFQKVYYEKVKPLEEEFEKEKKNVRIRILLIIGIAIGLETVLIGIFNPNDYGNFNTLMEVGLGLFIAVTLLSARIILNFTNKVKKEIFPELFKSINSNLIYDDVVRVPKEEFIDSNFYNSFNSYCSYSSQDSIIAKVDNKNIGMYELKVESGSGKSKSTVFSGLFLHIALDKTMQSNMKIVCNTSKDFGIFKTLFADEDKVNLENIDFENNYDVYCSDQIYARKIITLNFMEKLLHATYKLNRIIEISFKKNNIYIAINDLQLINDSDLFSKKIDMLNIATEIDNILTIVDTIDYLNLDEKIA